MEVVAPYIRGRGQIISGNSNWSTTILGVTPEYFEAREWGLENGRTFAAEEFRGNVKTVLLGNTVAQNLLPGEDPTRLRAARQPGAFEVAGLLQAKGHSHGRAGPGRPAS